MIQTSMNVLKTYPRNFEEKVGFTRIRELLKDFCVSDLGTEKVENNYATTSIEELNHRLNQQEELMNLISEQGYKMPEQGFYDLREDINSIAAENSWWEIDTFIDLRSVLRTSWDLLAALRKNENSYLNTLYDHIDYPKELLKEIEKIFTEKGEVSNNASPELKKLRQQIEQNQQQIRKNLNMIFRNARNEGWVPEGATVTIREGRMVIPLFAEAKRRIRGFVHDESATGQTVYIEPASILEGNNRQRELEYEERREVIRILQRLSRHVYEQSQSLLDIAGFLGEIDFLRAKMKLTEKLKAIKPETKVESGSQLRKARHPLLVLTDHDVVPLDIEINEEQRVVLISGPNAGGKSVSLKTVALLQYMVQHAFYIPAAEGSVVGTFDKIFIDIGDEQSIENDLSTYSSHLGNMKYMLSHVDDSSLILIDEFGSGTEPQFGGALAESILGELMKKQVKGVITTHYANLKTFADNTPGIVNAAMRFDIDNLRPMYQLILGKPGSSHALEIAQNTGLPDTVISKAKELLGQEIVSYDRALSRLQEQLQNVQDKEKELSEREKKTSKLIEEYERLKANLEENRKQLLDKAKGEAAEIVSRANKEIEKTIRHIKENKAEKKETKRIREQLTTFKEKYRKPEPKEASTEDLNTPIRKGDIVEIDGSNATGEVLDVQGNKVEVMIGSLKSLVKKDRLKKISRKEARKNRPARRNMDSITSRAINFSGTLDIRGKRVEEALPIVDKYMDDALLAGASEVRILHGKGSGVLKDVIRNHLKGYSMVINLEDENVERGGAGITVVTLEK